ncbi:MAG: hypothetical protein VX379_08985 [Pseudomonadota bacterium]|nr:hypothetical protein [Pseudomonadota bacterium]MEE3321547.1 hypothetical protein [Pseudomonadota bacterium]
MNGARSSLTVFGVYMMVIPGVGLMTVPELLLDLFGLGHGGYVWMARVIGLLAFIIGVFQFSIAKYALARLYRITVAQRYFAALLFIALWLKGEAEAAILLFAAVDLAGASWTLLATMKKDVNSECI